MVPRLPFRQAAGEAPGSWVRKGELVTGYTVPVSVKMTVIATPVSQPLS